MNTTDNTPDFALSVNWLALLFFFLLLLLAFSGPDVVRTNILLSGINGFLSMDGFMANNNQGKSSYLPLLVLAAISLGNLLLLSPVLQNGDSAVYLDQIARGDFSIRTSHIGYMAWGWLAKQLIPLPLETAMNLVCLLHASLAAWAMWMLSRLYGANKSLLWMAPLFAFTLPALLRSAVMSEVDTIQTAWILLSLWLYLSQRPAWAGPPFAMAMLVSPLSSLSLPLFLFLTPPASQSPVPAKERSLGPWLRRVSFFAASSLLVYLPVVVAVAEDYFQGPRGVFTAPHHPFDLVAQLQRSLFFYLANGLLLLPFLFLMLAELLFGASLHRHRRVAWVLLGTFGLMVLAGERFDDVPVQLPLLCVALAWLPVWLSEAHRETKVVHRLLFVSVLLSLVLGYRSVVHQWQSQEEFQTELRQLREELGAPCYAVGLTMNWDSISIFQRVMWHDTSIHRLLSVAGFINGPKPFNHLEPEKRHPVCFFQPMKRNDIRPFLTDFDYRLLDLGTSKRWVLVPKTGAELPKEGQRNARDSKKPAKLKNRQEEASP